MLKMKVCNQCGGDAFDDEEEGWKCVQCSRRVEVMKNPADFTKAEKIIIAKAARERGCHAVAKEEGLRMPTVRAWVTHLIRFWEEKPERTTDLGDISLTIIQVDLDKLSNYEYVKAWDSISLIMRNRRKGNSDSRKDTIAS